MADKRTKKPIPKCARCPKPATQVVQTGKPQPELLCDKCVTVVRKQRRGKDFRVMAWIEELEDYDG